MWLAIHAAAERERPHRRGRDDRRRKPTVERADTQQASSREPVGAKQQDVGAQHHQGEIGGQQVAQEFGELAAEVRQVHQGPDQHQQRLALAGVAAHQPPQSNGESDQTGNAERGSHRPLDDVLDHEGVRRRAGPLDHERDVDRPGADLDLVRLVRQPLRVQPQTPHRRTEEGIWLGDPEGEEGAHGCDAECGNTVEELADARPAPSWPDQRQPQDGQQQQRRLVA